MRGRKDHVALLAGIQGDTRGDIGKKAMIFSIVLSIAYIEYLAERKGFEPLIRL